MSAPIHIRAGDSRHQCPASVCRILIPASKLMCLDHWRKVPRVLQDAVYAAYDHGAGIGSDGLAQAQDAAIQAVEAKIARKP